MQTLHSPSVSGATIPTGIHIRGVYKAFSGTGGRERVLALQDINLDIRDREWVTILGPSGCGKTTLLRIVAGLTRPDQGEVTVNGELVRGPGTDRAVVFQNFALLPWANALDNVTFGLKMRGMPKRERRHRGLELLQMVGLDGFQNHLPKELSGGMQQRVGLARALTLDPSIMLMDEPFSAVDEQMRSLLQEQLLEIWEAQPKTILFVTHSIDEAVLLGERIVVLTPGPGRVSEDIDVPLPRPRGRATLKHPVFLEIKEHLLNKVLGEERSSLPPLK